jgi:hypothetical protein
MATSVLSSQHIQFPVGTTAERPGSPTAGMMRYNSSLAQMEVYDASNSAWTGVTQDLSPANQLNNTSQPHSVSSAFQVSGGGYISAYGAAGPSAVFSTYTPGGTFSSHGGHVGISVFPVYWAVYIGTPTKAVNRFVTAVHGNSWGYFFLEGSNDCGSGSNFHTNGTWTTLPFASSNNANLQNMGGGSSGYGEGTQLSFTYNNSTGYQAYRIRIVDSSRSNQSVGSQYNGSGGYWMRLDRT